MSPTRTNDFTPDSPVLAVSLELATAKWKMALQDGHRENPTVKTVDAAAPAARLQQVLDEIAKFKLRWKVCAEYRTVVMYEAGQDGFWIARELLKQGVHALVVDPASLPAPRQARRAKTDRLDAIMLVNKLRAWLRGERDGVHMLHMPEPDAEEQRHLARGRGELQKEITQHRDRIRKLLRTVGCWDAVQGDIAQRLTEGKLHCYDGTALPDQLLRRLLRECDRLHLVEQQFKELEKSLIEQLPEGVRERIATLSRLKAVGIVGATRLAVELFWRDFDNRKQVGAATGLVPQPYDSGERRVDQGISKQGNRRVRSLLIEMSWFWLRYQPNSSLSRWFAQKTGNSAKRSRRIAIVGVARKLAIGLWRYLKYGQVPEGAELKPSVS